MRIAAIQHDITWEDRDANFGHLAPLIASAAGAGARLALCTEMFSTGFSNNIDAIAEPVGGPSSQFLVEQARTNDMWVGGSCPEVADGEDRPHNSFVLAGPDGTVHRYRKIHPFTFAGEDRYFQAGTDLVTVDIEGLRVTMFVCYDLRFADDWWQVARQTDVYLCPSNWPEARRTPWMALTQARAIENQAYVVACNRVGDGNGLPYSGDSRIVDPVGELLATGSRQETIVLAEVSAGHVAETRDRFRFLQDRRTY